MSKWTLKNVAKAIAAASPPKQHQQPEAWNAMHKLVGNVFSSKLVIYPRVLLSSPADAHIPGWLASAVGAKRPTGRVE